MKRDNKRVKFNEMPAGELVKYITDIQHPYLVKSLSTISLCIKTITGAAPQDIEGRAMADLLTRLTRLIHTYLKQDEKDFFLRLNRIGMNEPINDLPEILAEIRKEHAAIIKLFKKIDAASGQYSPPESASAVIKLCYAQLFNFEQDMLTHIFLKEDILFPKLLSSNKLNT